jgi:glycosyltransferase involved in cell wall biosynthesis
MTNERLTRYLQEQLLEDQSILIDLLMTKNNQLEQQVGGLVSRLESLEKEKLPLLERQAVDLAYRIQHLDHFKLDKQDAYFFRLVSAIKRRWAAMRRRADTSPVSTPDTHPDTATSPPPPSLLDVRNQRDTAAMRSLVDTSAQAAPTAPPLTTLLVDVTHTISTTSVSGIQRMVRHIASHVIASGGQPVRILGQEISALNRQRDALEARAIAPGTTLLLPDVSWLYSDDLAHHMAANRDAGGKNIFVLTDILSATLPMAFPLPARVLFRQWLHHCVLKADAVICISKTTADELLAYCEQPDSPLVARPHIGWVHCGVEPLTSSPDHPTGRLLRIIRQDDTPFLLSVSTLEIRKGYPVMLDAMERVWESGLSFRYVIVGRFGWSQHALVQRLRSHPEFGKRLIWLEDVEDSELAWLYAQAHLLVSASVAEGFGLPIIEAAHYGTRALVSDISVYREIFSDHVDYFESLNSTALASAITAALAEKKPVTSLPARPWSMAMAELLSMISDGAYQYPAGKRVHQPDQRA